MIFDTQAEHLFSELSGSVKTSLQLALSGSAAAPNVCVSVRAVQVQVQNQIDRPPQWQGDCHKNCMYFNCFFFTFPVNIKIYFLPSRPQPAFLCLLLAKQSTYHMVKVAGEARVSDKKLIRMSYEWAFCAASL